MDTEVPFFKMKRALEMDCDDGCTTTRTYLLVTLNPMLKNGLDGKFYVVSILPQLKINLSVLKKDMGE